MEAKKKRYWFLFNLFSLLGKPKIALIPGLVVRQ